MIPLKHGVFVAKFQDGSVHFIQKHYVHDGEKETEESRPILRTDREDMQRAIEFIFGSNYKFDTNKEPEVIVKTTISVDKLWLDAQSKETQDRLNTYFDVALIPENIEDNKEVMKSKEEKSQVMKNFDEYLEFLKSKGHYEEFEEFMLSKRWLEEQIPKIGEGITEEEMKQQEEQIPKIGEGITEEEMKKQEEQSKEPEKTLEA